MSDDTAILTPQSPAPGPGSGGHVSGDTLTSGIPVIPAEPRSAFPGGPGGIRPPEGPMGGRPGDAGAPGLGVLPVRSEAGRPPDASVSLIGVRMTTGGIGREPGMLIRIRVVSVVSVLGSSG
ncbi:hypothetical protein [Streptomyces sp. wa22]|uniref:hypothetical protein n=1 Tax=Streptomyces sp. wa22 TaxID=1828244 RepID=UPI003966BA3F